MLNGIKTAKVKAMNIREIDEFIVQCQNRIRSIMYSLGRAARNTINKIDRLCASKNKIELRIIAAEVPIARNGPPKGCRICTRTNEHEPPSNLTCEKYSISCAQLEKLRGIIADGERSIAKCREDLGSSDLEHYTEIKIIESKINEAECRKCILAREESAKKISPKMPRKQKKTKPTSFLGHDEAHSLWTQDPWTQATDTQAQEMENVWGPPPSHATSQNEPLPFPLSTWEKPDLQASAHPATARSSPIHSSASASAEESPVADTGKTEPTKRQPKETPDSDDGEKKQTSQPRSGRITGELNARKKGARRQSSDEQATSTADGQSDQTSDLGALRPIWGTIIATAPPMFQEEPELADVDEHRCATPAGGVSGPVLVPKSSSPSQQPSDTDSLPGCACPYDDWCTCITNTKRYKYELAVNPKIPEYYAKLSNFKHNPHKRSMIFAQAPKKDRQSLRYLAGAFDLECQEDRYGNHNFIIFKRREIRHS